MLQIEEGEKFLFREIDSVILDCINESVDKQLPSTGGLVLKHLEHVKRTLVNRVSFITLEEHKDDEFSEITEEEKPPNFVCMPTRVQLMTMVANAAYHNE